jgi:hypothetical protein
VDHYNKPRHCTDQFSSPVFRRQQFTSIIDICEHDASAVATLQPEAEVQS